MACYCCLCSTGSNCCCTIYICNVGGNDDKEINCEIK